MSKLFNKAREAQGWKRIRRQEDASKKAKADSQKNSYGTYRGKDPSDGTDIVQAGNNEAVSGFKLTSDSPVGDGDRVNLKKNNDGGLQRADTKNKKKTNEEDQETLEYFTAELFWSDGLSSVGFETIFSLTAQIQYSYGLRSRNILTAKKPPPPSVNTYPPVTVLGSSAQSIGQSVRASANLASTIVATIPRFFCYISINIPKGVLATKIAQKIGGGSGLGIDYGDSRCPIQFEASINDVPITNIDSLTVDVVGDGSGGYSINAQKADTGSAANASAYNLRNKWRFTV